MSLLLSPLFLFLLGASVARLSKARRIWRQHSRFVPAMGALVLIGYYLVTVSLFADLDWTRGWSAWLPGETGTDWMVNSGVLSMDTAWPLADQQVVMFAVSGFVTFPFWFYLGVVSSFWLFGRSPRQTGVVGLLR